MRAGCRLQAPAGGNASLDGIPVFCFYRVCLAAHLVFVAGVTSSHFQERSRDSVFKYTCLRRHESVGRQIPNTFWNRRGAGVATAFTYGTLEILPSFRKPSRLPWLSLQGLCFILKDLPFPVRAPHVGSHRARFSSRKPRAMAGISGPQSPCLCRKEVHKGGSSWVLGGGGQVPLCLLALPPTAAGVAMVTKQAFPPLYPPAPHPQTRPFQGPRLLGVMETVSRHPRRASPLAGRACR